MRRYLGPAAIVLAIVAVIGGLWYVSKPNPNDPRTKLAQCLTDKGAKMYGAYWCPHCSAQKKLFGRGFKMATYVECGVPGNQRAQSQVCKDAGVNNYPTWEFADGTRVTGEQDLSVLAEKSGCTYEPS
jgi:hypothetical protein